MEEEWKNVVSLVNYIPKNIPNNKQFLTLESETETEFFFVTNDKAGGTLDDLSSLIDASTLGDFLRRSQRVATPIFSQVQVPPF